MPKFKITIEIEASKEHATKASIVLKNIVEKCDLKDVSELADELVKNPDMLRNAISKIKKMKMFF